MIGSILNISFQFAQYEESFNKSYQSLTGLVLAHK